MNELNFQCMPKPRGFRVPLTQAPANSQLSAHRDHTANIRCPCLWGAGTQCVTVHYHCRSEWVNMNLHPNFIEFLFVVCQVSSQKVHWKVMSFVREAFL